MKTLYIAALILLGTLFIGQHYYFKGQDRKLQEEKDMLCGQIAVQVQAKWGSLAGNLEQDCALEKVNDANQKISRAIDAIERAEHEKGEAWMKEEEERLKRELREWQEKEHRKEEFKAHHSKIIHHIKQWECGRNDYACFKDAGGNFIAYECAAGVMTIGWGHTATAPFRTMLSYEQAEDLLIDDIKHVMRQLRGLNIDLNQFTPKQQAAIVGAIFNVGYGNFRSMKSVVKILRQRRVDNRTLAHAWIKERPITVNGRPNRGLIARKNEEIKLIFGA